MIRSKPSRGRGTGPVAGRVGEPAFRPAREAKPESQSQSSNPRLMFCDSVIPAKMARSSPLEHLDGPSRQRVEDHQQDHHLPSRRRLGK